MSKLKKPPHKGKHPGGAPTKFKKEYCKLLIEHMSCGYSFESFAGLMNVARDTIYNWCDKHPEFLDAKKQAFEKSRLFWEEQGINSLWTNPRAAHFNSTVWIFNMKNRFGWKDKSEIELPTQTENKDSKLIIQFSNPSLAAELIAQTPNKEDDSND